MSNQEKNKNRDYVSQFFKLWQEQCNQFSQSPEFVSAMMDMQKQALQTLGILGKPNTNFTHANTPHSGLSATVVDQLLELSGRLDSIEGRLRDLESRSGKAGKKTHTSSKKAAPARARNRSAKRAG